MAGNLEESSSDDVMELVYHYKAKNKYLLGASEHTNSQNSIPHDFILTVGAM